MLTDSSSFLAKDRFIVLGGHKCGTTSLHHYLDQHPAISMPKIKGQDLLHKPKLDLEKYKDSYEYNTDIKVLGEVSSVYLYSESTCKNIQNLFPNTKLIVVLRNPVDRAFSHWKSSQLQNQPVFNNLDKLLKSERCDILKNGLYSSYIKMYYDEFGKDKIKVFIFDDFLKDKKYFFSSFFEFIGVDSNFAPNTLITFRQGGKSTNTKIQKIMNSNSFKSLAGYFIKGFTTPEQRRLMATYFNNLFIKKDTLTPELRQKLINFYKNDILETQELVQINLSHWL